MEEWTIGDQEVGLIIIKTFILLNTLIIPYHAAVVFAMAMSMAQAHSNQEIIDNLYWIVPLNLVFASLPNLLIVLLSLWKKEKAGLIKAFFIGEGYIILLQAALHGALILYSVYGPNI